MGTDLYFCIPHRKRSKCRRRIIESPDSDIGFWNEGSGCLEFDIGRSGRLGREIEFVLERGSLYNSDPELNKILEEICSHDFGDSTSFELGLELALEALISPIS